MTYATKILAPKELFGVRFAPGFLREIALCHNILEYEIDSFTKWYKIGCLPNSTEVSKAQTLFCKTETYPHNQYKGSLAREEMCFESDTISL